MVLLSFIVPAMLGSWKNCSNIHNQLFAEVPFPLSNISGLGNLNHSLCPAAGAAAAISGSDDEGDEGGVDESE